MEAVIEELHNEILWKDEEMKEMREELEALRHQNKKLRIVNIEEKANRQILESNKLKYTMLKELQECKGEIDNQTFFENKKN